MRKRPLPPSTAASPCSRAARTLAALLLLLPTCTAAQIDEEAAARKKGKEDHEANCVPLLAQALTHDADGSGGLNREEWTAFWSSIADGDTEEATNAKGDEVYAAVLSEQCDELDMPESFCDDTATTDEEVDSEDAGNSPFVFGEISLKDFGDVKPGKGLKGYHKQFCKDVTEALEVLELGGEGETSSSSTVPATASTESAGTSAATAAATEAAAASTAAAASSSTVASTAATETSTTTTTTTATTTSTTAAASVADQLVLTFLGSTGGAVPATDVDLDEVSHAFWKVALDILGDLLPEAEEKVAIRPFKGGGRRGLFLQFASEIMALFEGVVMDVDDVDCPGGLAYAAEGSDCLEFTYRLMPLVGGPLTQTLADEFATEFYAATDDEGELYDALIEEYPETDIIGLGNPGKGQPLDDATPSNVNKVVGQPDGGDAASTSSSGLAVGAIVGIVLAAALCALLLAALVVRHRRRQRRKLDESNLSEDMDANEISADAEWFDEEHSGDDLPGAGSPGSTLAAMGVASTVATRLTTGDTEVMLAEKQAWTKKPPVV